MRKMTNSYVRSQLETTDLVGMMDVDLNSSGSYNKAWLGITGSDLTITYMQNLITTSVDIQNSTLTERDENSSIMSLTGS